MQQKLNFQVLMRSQNLNEAQKFLLLKFLKSVKSESKKICFIFAPRLDFGYASKPKNSASYAMH
jgi:hypothetical protein